MNVVLRYFKVQKYEMLHKFQTLLNFRNKCSHFKFDVIYISNLILII